VGNLARSIASIRTFAFLTLGDRERILGANALEFLTGKPTVARPGRAALEG